MIFKRKQPIMISDVKPRDSGEEALLMAIKKRRHTVDEIVRTLHQTMRENRGTH